MKKFFSLFALALSLILSLGVLMACKPTPPAKEEDELVYTVTVTCDDEEILVGLKVQLKTTDGTVAGEKTLPAPQNGAASVNFALPAARYTVSLAAAEGHEEALSDYVYGLETLTAISRSALVSLTKADEVNDPVTYTLTLLYPDGTPAAGVYAQLCGGPKNMCYAKKTDASGVAVFTLDAGTYEVHLPEVPAGYAFDDSAYTMTAADSTKTVSLKAA